MESTRRHKETAESNLDGLRINTDARIRSRVSCTRSLASMSDPRGSQSPGQQPRGPGSAFTRGTVPTIATIMEGIGWYELHSARQDRDRAIVRSENNKNRRMRLAVSYSPRPLQPSTIGAGGLNYRVRNGIGCTPSAITTKRIRQFSRQNAILYAAVKSTRIRTGYPECCIALESHTNEIKTSAY